MPYLITCIVASISILGLLFVWIALRRREEKAVRALKDIAEELRRFG